MVLIAFAKLSENIMHDQLSYFLLSNKKFTFSQYAYCKLQSTIISLMSVSDYLYEYVEENVVSLAFFLNLKKTCYTKDHEILF